MSLPMLHSPAEVMMALMLSLDPSWPVSTASEPGYPDEVLTMYDTIPIDQSRSQIDGERSRLRGVQVRVRSNDHPTGLTKAQEVARTLSERVYDTLVTVGGIPYKVHCINRSGTIAHLGKESPASRRTLFTLNVLVSVRRAA